MKDAQDLYDLSAHAVRDEVGRAGNDELARAWDAARSAAVGVIDEGKGRFAQIAYEAKSCGRVSLEKVVLDGLEI